MVKMRCGMKITLNILAIVVMVDVALVVLMHHVMAMFLILLGYFLDIFWIIQNESLHDACNYSWCGQSSHTMQVPLT